jgi:hypothetical protein
MTAEVQSTHSDPEKKSTDKEFNFRALEAKNAAVQRQLESERQERERVQRELEELRTRSSSQDDSSDDEPYIDKKRLNKELAKYDASSKKQTKEEIQQTVQQAVAAERERMWLGTNTDFYDVMQHAEKIVQKDPELAETILQMPDTFERKKLVYRSIKTMGLHQPEPKQPSIQEKIDNNKKHLYYAQTSATNPPYAGAGDFSESGQKTAYDKMQELKKRMRLG